jgi:sugar O-acyltransferase (sialic acid O-acetyltransferase NeuD family)
MNDLIILGAGGASREIAGAVEDVNVRQQTWKLLGFLDDDPAKIGSEIDGVRVLGPISSAREYSAQFVIGIASARNRSARERVVEALGIQRDRFATVVHPKALLSRYATVGYGSVILQNVIINPDAVIGDHVIVEYGAMIGHDTIIEDFVTIGPGSIVSGSVRLRRSVFLGTGSMIKDGVTVNQGALIGMGAVVVKEVPLETTVIGNPARPIGS